MINSQGYNFGNGGSSGNGFRLNNTEATRKYIMNTKSLLGVKEESPLNEAVKKPMFDPYRTPEHRLEYSLYGGEYYCASDIKVYIGDIWVDDAIAIDYVLQEKVTPVYGYASYTFDDIARGQRLVSGSLAINFKSAGYMQNVLKYADAIMYALKVGENNGSVKAVDFQNYKLNELLGMLNKRSFQQIADEYEKALWGDINEENQNTNVLNHDLMPFFPHSNLGFDIRIHYGPVDEVMANSGLDYYKELYQIKEPEYTVEVINGIQLTTLTKGIGTDQQSIPITEQYMFIARDLNGISKDRFVAQMEFKNMDADGSMFGNATSSSMDSPKSEILGYEKSQYSADGVNTGSTGNSFKEVKYVSNKNGDSALFFSSEFGSNITARLIGVDAYDLSSYSPKEKQYAEEAKSYLEALLTESTTIKLEFEGDSSNQVINKNTGAYNAYIHIDGDLVNILMARRGLAKLAYASYGNDRHRKAIQAAEQEARLAKRGIWSILPQEPHHDLTDKELEEFFELNPSLSGNMTVQEWKKKNK